MNCIKIALTAKTSSPIFDPRYVNHKKEKVNSIVLIKISILIVKSFKILEGTIILLNDGAIWKFLLIYL